MGLISSGSFEEIVVVAEFLSTVRVERDGRLLYAVGDPIAADDVETLVAQGHVEAKARVAGADKARKPAKNK